MAKRKSIDVLEPNSPKRTPAAITAQQKALVTQFVRITHADKTDATKWLRKYNWNLNNAISNYTAEGSVSPYQSQLEALFVKYRAMGNDNDTMDVDATQKYFADVGVDLSDVSSLIASTIVGCPTMGQVTQEGFVQGWSEYGYATVAKQKDFIASLKTSLGNSENQSFFEKVYKHSFQLLLATPGQRSVDKAQCVELWTVLFSPPSMKWETEHVNWLKEWNDFVEGPSCSIKGINRDQWNHVLKLATMTMNDDSLDWHDEEQSWPSIIDDFVADFKERHPKANQDEMEF